MKICKLVFLCLSLMLSFSLSAQTSVKLEEIEIVNLGDGQMFGHQKDAKDKPLEGKLRIITGYTTEYIDVTFNAGFMEGRWEYFKKNELSEYRTYKNGYLDGECGELRPNGDRKETGFFKNGKKDGLWTEYYSDEEPKQSDTFVEGDLRKRVTYYTDGSVESERNFLNKKEHGQEKHYKWDTKKLTTEKNYENGKQVGKQMQYYSSNQNDYIQLSNYSKNGKLDGKYTETYAETGKMKVEGVYKEGKKEGVWKYGTLKGTVSKEEKYEAGKLTETKKFEN